MPPLPPQVAGLVFSARKGEVSKKGEVCYKKGAWRNFLLKNKKDPSTFFCFSHFCGRSYLQNFKGGKKSKFETKCVFR